MEKIIWNDRLRKEVLQKFGQEYPIKLKRRKANWFGHILRRNCVLKHVTEGEVEVRIEVTSRWGRRGKRLLNDLKERRD